MILVCGEVLFDVFVAQQRADGLTLDARLGGSPFNVALGLARLGHPVELLTGVSDDVLGRQLMALIEATGVGLHHAVRSRRQTALSIVGLDAAGQPDYAFYGHPAAYCAVTSADLPALDGGVGAIHVGSIATVLEPMATALIDLVERERTARLISYDPNVRPSIEPDLQVWRDRLERLSQSVHLLKISAEDLALLYPGLDDAEAARRWLARGVKLVVVTHGARGARGFTPRCRAQVAGMPVALIDTVGAGDSFQAALLAGLAEAGRLSIDGLDGLDADGLTRLLALAGSAAAITCSRRGADLPYRHELPPAHDPDDPG